MSLTSYPNGILTPIVVAPGLISSTGKVFFVNNSGVAAPNGVTGSDGGGVEGTSPANPFLTITKAHSQCVSGRGDVINVSPGTYDENLTITKDYVQIIGVMIPGYARPDVTPTSGAALIIHAQGFVCKHVRFVGTGVGGIGVQQSGNGFIYDDCVFESTSNIGLRLFPDQDNDSFTASEGKVLNSLVRDCAGGGITFENPGPGIAGGVSPTDVEILGCRFYGNAAVGDILDVYTAGGNLTTFARSIIRGNSFMDSEKAKYIDLNGATVAVNNTGQISGNYFSKDLIAAANIDIVGTAITVTGNYDNTGVIDGSGF